MAGDNRNSIKRIGGGPGSTQPLAPTARWQVGQILRGTVIHGTPPGHGGGQARLRIGSREVAVRAQVPIRDGDHVTLSLEQVHPRATMRLLAINGRQPDAERQLRKHWRASRLNQQLGLNSVLLLARAGSALLNAKPNRTLLDLRATLPRVAQLITPAGLSHSLHTAGLWFEGHLAVPGTGAQTPSNNLKGALMRAQAELNGASTAASPNDTAAHLIAEHLANTAPPNASSWAEPQPGLDANILTAITQHLGTPGVLSRIIRGALARIELWQLLAQEVQATESLPSWHLEIPVFDAHGDHVLALVIAQESGDRSASGSRWSAHASLHLPDSGPVWLRVSLSDRRLAARFWVMHDGLKQRVEAKLPALRERLRQLGFTVDQLVCDQGEPRIDKDSGFRAPSVEVTA